jgi:hypothetical protein
MPYYRYEVLKPLRVAAGKTAPWFDQPGGGIQYKTGLRVQGWSREGTSGRPGRLAGSGLRSISEPFQPEHDAEKREPVFGKDHAHEHDPEKWEPVFGKDHAQRNPRVERWLTQTR